MWTSRGIWRRVSPWSKRGRCHRKAEERGEGKEGDDREEF